MDIDKKRQELIEQNKEELKRGLGDTIEEVFKKTGISYIAKKALGDDCGCNKRKKKLNKMFPYKGEKKVRLNNK
tara:strand:- start:386 stop:607 length:222 start_codon:yes stop_codon:yes gene_type:complete